MTEQEFINEMNRIYAKKAPMFDASSDYAKDVLYCFLHSEGIEFGDDGYDWSEEAANIIVDEDMSYWED